MCIPFNLSKVELIEIDLPGCIHHFLQHCTQTGHCSLEKVSPNRIVSPFSNIFCFLVLVCVCSDSHVTLMCRTYPQNIYGNVTNASAVWNNMYVGKSQNKTFHRQTDGWKSTFPATFSMNSMFLCLRSDCMCLGKSVSRHIFVSSAWH